MNKFHTLAQIKTKTPQIFEGTEKVPLNNNNCNNLRSRKLSFSAPFFVYLALIIEFFRCY
ncbi:GTP-binding protein Era [Flavobacteria bacterium BAL38]|nr:GTP-binding protein Era [Flavobacteria bacterium BAL38]